MKQLAAIVAILAVGFGFYTRADKGASTRRDLVSASAAKKIVEPVHVSSPGSLGNSRLPTGGGLSAGSEDSLEVRPVRSPETTGIVGVQGSIENATKAVAPQLKGPGVVSSSLASAGTKGPRVNFVPADAFAPPPIPGLDTAQTVIFPTTPLVLLPATETAPLNEEHSAALNTIRKEFGVAIGGPNQDPSEPQYFDRWQTAQWIADQQYWSVFGQDAYAALIAERSRD